MSERKRWRELEDRLALDEELTSQELDFVASFEDESAGRERAFFGALSNHGRARALEPDDLARATAALEGRRATATRARSPWMRPLVTAMVVAAAAALIWVLVPGPPMPSHQLDEARVTRGTLMLDQVELGVHDVFPAERWATAVSRGCVRVRTGKGCAEPSSRIRLHDHRLELDTGALEFEGDGEVLAHGLLASGTRAHMVVRIVGAGVVVDAVSGTVQVQIDGESGTLAAGDRYEWFPARPQTPPAAPPSIDPPAAEVPAVQPPDVESPPPVAATPGELMSRARKLVARGKLSRALGVYAELRRAHPKSAAAQAANVSIGQLELQRGRRKVALRAFDRYLASGGPLAEEAHWGKIRALHGLGRADEEAAAMERLRSAFPRSVYLELASRL